MFSASATPAVFPGTWPPLCQAGTGMSQSCDRTLSGKFVQPYVSICDKYCLGGEMWGSESADAGGQGRIWASAYPDILLARNELDGFTTMWCHLPQYADRSEREYPSTVMTGNGKPLVLAHRTFCP